MNELFWSFFIISSIIAWVVSLVYCIAQAEWLAVLVLHVFLAPVGVIHGWFVAFGNSWF